MSSSNSQGSSGRIYYGWVVLAACFFVSFVTQGIRFSFSVFFMSLQTEFNLTRALTSGIFSAYMIFSGLFLVVGGWAMDRYGPKGIVAVMGIFSGLSLIVSSQANTIAYMFVSYSLLLAVGTGPAYAIVMSTASKWFIRRRGLAIGIVQSGVNLGVVVMPPIAAWLIASFGWQSSYLIIGISALTIMTPCAFLFRNSPNELLQLDGNSIENKPKIDVGDEQYYGQPDGFSLIQAAKTIDLPILFFAQFSVAFCIFTVAIHVVPHAIDLGYSDVQAALILSIIGGASIPGTLLLGRASDTIGRKKIILLCAVSMAIAMLLLVRSFNQWLLYLFAVIWGFFRGGISPPLTALIGDTFGLSHIGLIMAVTGIGWTIGAAAGPALAGYLFDISSNYNIAFMASIVVLLISAILISRLKTQNSSVTLDNIQ